MANQKKLKLTGFKFKPFSKKQMKVLTYWQDNSPVSDKFLLVADGSVRSGKEQPLDANIFTPDGVKKMGELHVGDFVLGRDGNPTKILGVFPQGLKDVYRITFHDGSSTECGRNHLWSYTTKKCITNGNYTMYTSTLSDIMQDLDRLKTRKHMFERAGRYKFPLSSKVSFNSREVYIDPYLLGLLLGDGCFSPHNSGVTFINDEQELHDYIEKILPQYGMQYYFTPRKRNHCAYGRLGNKSGHGGNKTAIRKLLEKYELYGCKSHTKFVPDDYKYNSDRVRIAILAGLLNTDGSVHIKNRPGIMFCSVSKQLRDDVVFLARSLGMWCSTERKDDEREGRRTCYSCSIRVNNDLYLLLSSKHKQRLNLDTTKSKDFRIIKSIEYVGKKECQCIYVDNSEHLYLTDDFIVTHNTVICSLSFVLFVMNTFNNMSAAMVGKSSGTLRRNVINTLKQMLLTLGYTCVDHRADNYLEITKGDTTNLFYLFGAKDESSQDLIQGATLCGLYVDECCLIPESFFLQATARLSVDNSKVMVCTNPASPHHWFYQNVLKKLKEKNGMYVHFDMDDNLSLSEEVKNRYKTMYSGVFYKRYIEGKYICSLFSEN